MHTRFGSQRTVLWILPLWAAAALIAAGALPARAAVIFSDDFNSGLGGATAAGTTLNPSIWASGSSSPTLAAEYPGIGSFTPATLDGTGDAKLITGSGALISVNEYSPSMDLLQLTVKLTSVSIATLLGFNDAAGDRISIRNDSGAPGTTWGLIITNASTDAGADTVFSTSIPKTGGAGTWVFTWSSSEVKLAYDSGAGLTQLFDSSVNTPIGDGGWNFPTVPLPAIVLFGAATVDQATLEQLSIPEPASLALLAVSSVLLMRRRR